MKAYGLYPYRSEFEPRSAYMYTYPNTQQVQVVVKKSVTETYDENGKLICRETVEEYGPVQQAAPVWQQPLINNGSNTYAIPARQPLDLDPPGEW